MRTNQFIDLEKLTIEKIPEIRDEYDAIIQNRYEVIAMYEEGLESLKQFKGKDKAEIRYGETLVFEDLVVPFIIRASQIKTVENQNRLWEIFEWFEELSNSDDFRVRNTVAVGLCTSLITTHAEHLSTIIGFMGEKTKGLCVMQFPAYRISDRTKRLFNH